MKNIFRKQTILRDHLCALLVVLCLLAAPVAHAQEAEEEAGVLTPNMTVNIKLNSALSDKETAFYSKIAQDIINQIPREVTLDEQMSKLREINDQHEHVNIVSYLPATEDVSTDKLIQHFKVKFVFADDEGAKTPEEATISAATVGLKKPQPPKEPEPEPAKPESEQKATPELQPKVAPKPATPAPVVKKPAPKAPKVSDLRLAYQADETELSFAQRHELMKLVNKIRATKHQPEGYTFVVRSYNGPTGENTWLAQERLRSVTALLRQQDINLARANVTEIYIHTNNEQFVEVIPVN